MRALMLLLFLLGALPAAADQITLLNGDRLTGTVSSIAGGRLLFATEHLGELDIAMDQVATVEQLEPLVVSTVTGDELKARLSVADGQQALVSDAGSRPVLLADLTSAVPEPSEVPWTWTNTVDFGWVVSTGNSETESRSLHYDSSLVSGRQEHRLFAYVNQDEADDVTTRDTLDAGYDFRWYFRDQWYALATLGYFKDELKEIDRRITVGAGVGHQFWDNAISSLSTELGISQVFESLAGDSESNPAVRWAVDFNRWIRPDAIDFFYGQEVLKILDSDRGEIYKANTGIRFFLSERWNANARLDVIHETDPPEGRDNTDLVYSVGIGLVF